MQTTSLSRHFGLGNRFSLRVLLAVVGLHVVVAVMLLSMSTMPTPPQLTTLIVRVIQAESPKRDEARRDVIVPPTSAARLPVPSAVPLPQPQILAVKAGEPSPAVAMPVLRESPIANPAAPQEAVSQPRFDADYLDNPAPVYPVISRRMREEGKVLLRVFVEPNGRPSQIQVSASSDSPRLDKTAQEAVWHWKFVPAQRGSEAVGAWVLVPIVFSLRG